MVRTKESAGLGDVRYSIRVVVGVGSGDMEAWASGDGARGAYGCW